MGVGKREALEQLRRKVAAIEKKPLLADIQADAGHGEGPLELPAGVLHEIRHTREDEGTSAAGFALAMAASWLDGRRTALFYLQLRRSDWIGGMPYGPGLLSSGLDPASVVLCRPDSIEEMLWAAEEAAGCRAVAGVILDLVGHKHPLEFTHGRRLALRAGDHGCGIAVVRKGDEGGATAATYRWGVSPSPSLRQPWDDKAPGAACWWLALEKGHFPRFGHGTRRRVGFRNGGMWPVEELPTGLANVPDNGLETGGERHGRGGG